MTLKSLESMVLVSVPNRPISITTSWSVCRTLLKLFMSKLFRGLLDVDGNILPCFNRPGYQKIVPSEGMPISKDPNTKGNLIIQFNLEFPSQLNPEQKRLLKEALLYPALWSSSKSYWSPSWKHHAWTKII